MIPGDFDPKDWRGLPDVRTGSLWQIDRGNNHVSYPGLFVPEVPYQLMRRYTKPGDWVLDGFVGGGTTLIEAKRLGRNAVGVELNEEAAKQAYGRAKMAPGDAQTHVWTGDTSNPSTVQNACKVADAPIKLAILHPPYYDIIKYSTDKDDLSNVANLAIFYEKMRDVFEGVNSVVAQGGHVALVIGDCYRNGQWVTLGFNTMQRAHWSWVLKGVIVKNMGETKAKGKNTNLWRYRALAGGFYKFEHEYIFVWRKAANGKQKPS